MVVKGANEGKYQKVSESVSFCHHIITYRFLFVTTSLPIDFFLSSYHYLYNHIFLFLENINTYKNMSSPFRNYQEVASNN